MVPEQNIMGKALESKPACHVLKCNKKHTKELHDLLTKGCTSVNMLGC